MAWSFAPFAAICFVAIGVCSYPIGLIGQSWFHGDVSGWEAGFRIEYNSLVWNGTFRVLAENCPLGPLRDPFNVWGGFLRAKVFLADGRFCWYLSDFANDAVVLNEGSTR